MQQKIPSISELRRICQSEKLARDRRFWYTWVRKMSIYITWAFLHTGITANQVTVLTVVLVLVGTVLLAFPQPSLALCGTLAYVAYHFLDKVDGEIARYRQKFSIVGVYLDEVGHMLVFAGIFVGLGFHLAWQNSSDIIMILSSAMLGALAMVIIRQNKSIGCLLYAQYVLEQPRLLPNPDTIQDNSLLTREATHKDRSKPNGGTGSRKGFVSLTRDMVLTLSQFTIMLNLIILGLIVELITGNITFLKVLLLAETILQIAVLAALILVNYKVNISAECLRLDRISRKQQAIRDDK